MSRYHPKNVRRALRLLAVFAAPCFALVIAGCGTSDNDGGLSVAVSIEPQAGFVEQIAGDLVAIEVLVRPGQSPATYDPTAQQIARLADCRVLFRIGVPFEDRLLVRLSSGFTGLAVVDTRAGIDLRPIDRFERSQQQDDHTHGRYDPHIWLDPSLVKLQAGTICSTLCAIDSGHAVGFRSNLDTFHRRLDSLDESISTRLRPYRGRTIYAFHPSWGYYADAYGLRQLAIEVNGKEPSARDLAAIIEQATRDSARVIFVQQQFSEDVARAVAEAVAARVIRIDPLGRDYFRMMDSITTEIVAGFTSVGTERSP